MKIFDFGVSHNPQHIRRASNKLGFKGTPRYMANEVRNPVKTNSYGLSADVYLFGVRLWEIYTLQHLFSKMKSLQDYKMLVVFEKMRPNLDLVKHNHLQKLIATCWNADPEIRLLFVGVRMELEQFVKYKIVNYLKTLNGSSTS